jgi:hypothetical protein
MYSGEPAKAIEALEANMRLDPFAPPTHSSGIMGLANYMLKRCPEVVRWFRETAFRLPKMHGAPYLARLRLGAVGTN